MAKLRIILRDHLTHSLPILKGCNPSEDTLWMGELQEDMTHVRHHQKKIAFILSAMRHFAQELEERGFNLVYRSVDDPLSSGSLEGELLELIKKGNFDEVLVTAPSEYRTLQALHALREQIAIPLTILPDPRFLSSPAEFAQWAEGRKQLRMEHFYREMRKKYDILMDGPQPTGGDWNYDQQNRQPPPKGVDVPPPFHIDPDPISREVISIVGKLFGDHFGDLHPFYFAVNQEGALKALELFIDQRLERFGSYQDAMVENEPWMFHSHISFYLNIGLLTPLECIEVAERAYHEGRAPLNAVEGFIRQILGWREYVRGIYWLKMPGYAEANFLEASRPLPQFYWDGKTKMNCMKQCIKETRENAYAHHIQRLMVLGNFALIAGIHPDEINEWYLIVYADAFEWVELPNVSGMVLFADGGYLASKPYAAGGSYIHKMSNYCKGCHYQVKEKTGERACPFNYLYWDFLKRNRPKLQSNHRLAMMYKTYDRMDASRQEEIERQARAFFNAMPGG